MFKTRIEAVYLGYKNGLEDYMKQDGEWKWASVTLSVPIIAYTVAALAVFWHTGSEPATLTACVFGVCGIENGVMGWIKTSKEKAAEAAKTNGSGPRAAPMDPPTEREEPPDVGL